MTELLRFDDVTAEAPIPERGILSATLSEEGGVTLVAFGFAAGEELTEHTSARPVIVHVLRGEADITVVDERFTGRAGTWFRMAPGTPHSIRARVPVSMLLYLLPPVA